MGSKPAVFEQRLNLRPFLKVLHQARLHELLGFLRCLAHKCPVRLLRDYFEANIFLRRSRKRVFTRKQYEREDTRGPNIDSMIILLLIAELRGHTTGTTQG